MKTLTLTQPNRVTRKEKSIPHSARGRALYTVDWFLSGKRNSRNFDYSKLTINRAITI